MSPLATVEYLATMAQRYRAARARPEKSAILTEICATCGFHRKHVIRLLGRRVAPRRLARRFGRASSYARAAITEPLTKIWLTANLPCSKPACPRTARCTV